MKRLGDAANTDWLPSVPSWVPSWAFGPAASIVEGARIIDSDIDSWLGPTGIPSPVVTTPPAPSTADELTLPGSWTPQDVASQWNANNTAATTKALNDATNSPTPKPNNDLLWAALAMALVGFGFLFFSNNGRRK
jgi:hypothetical protein